MEILQTIWTALTTENEVLITIFSIPLTFLEAIITTLLFTSIFNINANNKTKLLYASVFSFTSILLNYFVPTPYNTFINVLICPVLIILFFKINFLKAILAEIIPYIVFFISGVITLSIYIILFKINDDHISYIPLYRITFSLCAYFFAYIILCVLKNYNLNITLLDNIKYKNNRTLFINFIIGILAIVVQSYIATFYNEILPLKIMILNIFTLLLYFIISMYSLIRTNKLEITEQNLEQSRQYINTLTILHDSIRCFKHDFQNIVTTIGRLCTNR